MSKCATLRAARELLSRELTQTTQPQHTTLRIFLYTYMFAFNRKQIFNLLLLLLLLAFLF